MPTLRFSGINTINWKDKKTYFALPFVLIVFAFWKPLESLRQTVWRRSGWLGGSLHELLAFATACGVAVEAHYTSGLPFARWIGQIGEAIGAGFITWAYIFPLVWLLILRPAYKFLKYCWEHFDFIDNKIVGPLLRFVPRLYSFLPGAQSGWDRMKDDNWFVSLLTGITYVAGGLSSLYAGWQVQKYVAASVHVGAFGDQFVQGASWAAAMVVAGLLGRVLSGALSAGGKMGLGTIYGAMLTYACSGWLKHLAALTGIPAYAFLLFVFIIITTYLLPILYLIFASGFWTKLWKLLEPLYESFFQGKESAFRHVVLQSFAIFITFVIAYPVYHFGGLAGFHPLLVALSTLATMAVVYSGLPRLLDEEYGNLLVDLLLGLAVGTASGMYYASHGYVFGVYGGIACGVVLSIITFAAVPLLYKGVEFLATLPGVVVPTNWLGRKLPLLYEVYIREYVVPLVDTCDTIYREGYGRSASFGVKEAAEFASFKRLTLHGTNAVLTGMLATATYYGLHSVARLNAFEPYVTVVACALVVLFSVGLLSKATLRATLEFPGALVSLLVGYITAEGFLPATPLGIWAAAPAGIIAAIFTFGLAFPIAMITLRAVFFWVPPLLNVPCDWVADKSWALVRGTWKVFCKLFHFVYDLFEPIWKWLGKRLANLLAFLGRIFAWVGRKFAIVVVWMAPFWAGVANICTQVWTTCRDVWKGIFGGK